MNTGCAIPSKKHKENLQAIIKISCNYRLQVNGNHCQCKHKINTFAIQFISFAFNNFLHGTKKQPTPRKNP